MSKILLVPSDVEESAEAARLLCARCSVAGLDAYVQPPSDRVTPIVDVSELSLVVPMGGDGTFLHAAHLIGFAPVPLLGLNHGTLGFLSGSPDTDELQLIVDALSGDLLVERRSTLDATVVDAEGRSHELTAFNEIAYTRGASGHMVEYSYAVNGTPVARLKADGLVMSTATGSTAYALSAGGPIMSPGYKGLLAVPIAPHSLSSRALVLAPSDVLEVTMSGRYFTEASVFVDGQSSHIAGAVSMMVRRGDSEVLIANGGYDFFSSVSRTFFQGMGDADD